MELRELHAEMLKVKKEVTQVVLPAAPPTIPPPGPTIVPLEEEDDGEDGDITPMARDDDAFLGLHQRAFEVPDREANGGETPDDCSGGDCAACDFALGNLVSGNGGVTPL